ncbi:MAG TPA: Hsp20/alpha crystallin family protein [Vicinamibacterales bacterium]
MFTNKLTTRAGTVLPKPLPTFEGAFGFPLFEGLSREVDDLFNSLGIERHLTGPRNVVWTPEVEVFMKNSELIVRADLPGFKKEDIAIELTEDTIVLKGERKEEKEEKREGYYQTERFYGSFYRALPLPEGVKIENAKAVVRDGVLEITVPMEKADAKTRRLEITEAPETKTVKAA